MLYLRSETKIADMEMSTGNQRVEPQVPNPGQPKVPENILIFTQSLPPHPKVSPPSLGHRAQQMPGSAVLPPGFCPHHPSHLSHPLGCHQHDVDQLGFFGLDCQRPLLPSLQQPFCSHMNFGQQNWGGSMLQQPPMNPCYSPMMTPWMQCPCQQLQSQAHPIWTRNNMFPGPTNFHDDFSRPHQQHRLSGMNSFPSKFFSAGLARQSWGDFQRTELITLDDDENLKGFEVLPSEPIAKENQQQSGLLKTSGDNYPSLESIPPASDVQIIEPQPEFSTDAPGDSLVSQDSVLPGNSLVLAEKQKELEVFKKPKEAPPKRRAMTVAVAAIARQVAFETEGRSNEPGTSGTSRSIKYSVVSPSKSKVPSSSLISILKKRKVEVSQADDADVQMSLKMLKTTESKGSSNIKDDVKPRSAPVVQSRYCSENCECQYITDESEDEEQ